MSWRSIHGRPLQGNFLVITVKSIELYEWDQGSTDATSLSKAERKLLGRFNESIKKRDGNDAITISYQEKLVTYSYAGIVQIGKKRIEILPKLFKDLSDDSNIPLDPATLMHARKNLFSLLSFCGLIPVHKSAMSHYDNKKDFFEFLVSLFLDDLENALIAQLHREYVTLEEETPFLRGRINLKKEITKPLTKKNRFFCIYDEFSADNPFNRVIKASLKRIREICRYEDNRKRADIIYIMLDEVSDSILTPQSFSKIKITRLNENYREIIQFCRLILFGETVSSDSGMEDFYALIFDMNLVFERYFTRLLRNSFPEKFQFHYQEQLSLASNLDGVRKSKRNRRELFPDILVKEEHGKNTENLAIIDTKYKLSLARDKNIANSDLYQMMAYCVASDTDKAILIYPSLPQQEIPSEKDYWIFLDKLTEEKNNQQKTQEKSKRTIRISARSVQILSDNGQKILHQLRAEDRNNIEQLFVS